MKKFTKSAIALTMAAAMFTGCSSKPAETKAPETTKAPEGTTQAAEATTAAQTEAATQAPETDSHLNVAMFMWMEGLDPGENWNGWTTMRCGIGETLMTADENMDVVPQLADSYEQVDETTYKFHIRQGVKFSNGNDMTPELVKASIERTVEMNSRGGNLKLESIEVDGENVIFKTTEPYSGFIYMLTEPMCIIVDTSVDTSNFNADPICTGPYRCVEYVTEEKYEMVKNEYYWGGVPDVDSITVLNVSNDTKVSAMLAGDLDIACAPATTTLSQVEGSSNIQFVQVTGTRESDLSMNMRADRPTSDKNLRLALTYSVNRDVIAQIAGNGYLEALTTAFPKSAGYNSDQVTAPGYDLEKAKECLAAAGYADSDGNGYVDKDGEELVLELVLASTDDTAPYQALQDMWKEIGIHLELKLLENVKEARANGDFDFIVGGWQTTNNADGQSYLMNRWSTGGADNYSAFSSEAFDAVMKKLDAAFTEEERVAGFVEAQQVLADECPNIFLYAKINVTLINSDKVSNVTVFPIDYYQVTGDWVAVQ